LAVGGEGHHHHDGFAGDEAAVAVDYRGIDQAEAGHGGVADGGELVAGQVLVAFKDEGRDRIVGMGADEAGKGDHGAGFGMGGLEAIGFGAGIEGRFGDEDHITPSVDLILSLSKDEVVATAAFPTSWFDRLTMRSSGDFSRRSWAGEWRFPWRRQWAYCRGRCGH